VTATAAGTARAAALEAVVHRLISTPVGDTFNQYAQGGDADRDPRTAPGVRAANLRTYLRRRASAPVLLVAEAAGWRGARYSGLPLFSERMIDEAATPYQRTSTQPRGFAEGSATVVQGVLVQGGWTDAVLIWNVVMTHPRGAQPHSNRPPRRGEVEAGRRLLEELLTILAPRHVLAVGRTAQAALPAGLDAPAIRHPAQSGATLCRRQLAAALEQRLG
jgi:hypothetical protein